jgi:RND family efflux transporter MFP subunit
VQTEQQKALALAQLDSARAQQALARVSLASHSLVAPFAGTVTAAPDGVGTVVSPGSALFKLVNLEKLKLETTVSESDANLLQVGAPVTITTGRGSVVGRISALLGALDERTRRVPVHAAFENPGQLRVGSFVRATVEAGEAIGVLRLPHDVLKPGSDTEVFVITGDGETSLLQSRLITYALDKDGSLLVRSGLAAQDRVLLSPKPESATGDKVVVVPAAAKDAQTEGDALGSSAAAAAPEKH